MPLAISLMLGSQMGDPIELFLASPQFYAPLQTTVVPTIGSGSASFTRATTKTFVDWEGVVRTTLSGEVAFQGARRVYNFWSTSSEYPVTTPAIANITQNDGGTTTLPDGTVLKLAQFTLTGGNGSHYVGDGAASAGPIWSSAYFDVTNLTTKFVMDEKSGISFTWTGAQAITVSGAGAYKIIGNYKAILYVLLPAGSTNNCVWFFGAYPTYNGDGQYVLASRFMREQTAGQANQNPSEYVSVGVASSPFHGAMVDGVKYFDTENGNTVASNVVTEATGAAIPKTASGVRPERGYLAEQASTNRCLHSQDFSNAVWAATNVTKASNEAVAPDGTTTADTLTATAANGTVIQDLGVVASAAKNGALWIKRKTGTGNIQLTLDGGTTWTTQAVTGTWTRFQLNQTLADEDFGIRLVTSGDAVWVWQGQVETLSFGTSDIPTTTAAVTRNRDDLSYPVSGNVSGTAGSSYAEAMAISTSTGGDNTVVDMSSNADGRLLYFNNNGTTDLKSFDGTTVATVTGPTSVVGNAVKLAGTWSGSTFKLFNGGTAGSGAAFDGYGTTGGNITLGNRAGSSVFSGIIREVKIWTSAGSDASMVRATT